VVPVFLTLVHSPLVGPGTWEAVAAAARDRGHQVSVPDLRPALSKAPPFAARQVALVADAVGQRETVLVGHSGAGPLLAAAGDACGDVGGYVYLDAGMPAPGKSWFETVPAELAAHVRGMARDGWLPPWSEWWGPDEVADLLPDPQLRRRFVAECPPLPVAMFEEPLPSSPGWASRPSAYLRLSDAYEEPAAQARALGWPVIELNGHHLSVLTEPELVIDAILDLIGRLSR
jgi:pimeloyl-ACP methyl ester carboxylesterase